MFGQKSLLFTRLQLYEGTIQCREKARNIERQDFRFEHSIVKQTQDNRNFHRQRSSKVVGLSKFRRVINKIFR